MNSAGQEKDPVLEQSDRRAVRMIPFVLLIGVLWGTGAAWMHQRQEAERQLRLEQRLTELEAEGLQLIEGRQWEEARGIYRRIEALRPQSIAVVRGRERIEEGERLEREQFVGYWSGQAIAAFEADRLDDAERAARRVLERYPGQSEVEELLGKIDESRLRQLRAKWKESAMAAVAERRWERFEEALGGAARELPEGDPLLDDLRAAAEAERERQRQELARAADLAEKARKRDRGRYDREALEWMREAIALAPDDPEIRALYERISAYTRTLRVPEEFPGLAEALAEARDKDRIVLGEGSFEGGVVIAAAVRIEGAGADATVLSAVAEESPALTVSETADGASVSGVTLRQDGLDTGARRYPVVLVEGGRASFTDCVVRDGSGHGLTAAGGGRAEALRCRFEGNAWGGAGATGDGSTLRAEECAVVGNFGHGIEFWDGGGGEVTGCSIRSNSGNGVLVDTGADELRVSDNELRSNREFGIVVSAGGPGELSGNVIRDNLLGGMVVRFEAFALRVERNRLESNEGPGLVLERGLRPELFESNVTRSNRGRDRINGARLPASP